MTRIALVSPFTLPFLCGNSILVDRLMKGLSGRGHRVSLFDSGKTRPEDVVPFEPEVLHSLNADRPHQWVKEFLRGNPVPWVITLTGTDYNSWCGKREPPPHIRKNLERAGALVVFHEEALQSLNACLPSVAKKIEVIAQGVSQSGTKQDAILLRREIGIGTDEIVFLMVSSIRPVKNVGAAIEAFSEVEMKFQNTRLLLIGPVWDQEEGRRILERGRRLRCFSYLGEKPQSEVRKFMAASDIFLNTSLNEGMPGAVLEAMAEGLPILASFIEGNRSLVVDGENGLLFSVDKKEDLTEAAVRLAQDQPLRRRMGEIGRQIVRTRHSVDLELDRYEEVYRQLLKQ
jgi:L-malate glycosyltransferase